MTQSKHKNVPALGTVRRHDTQPVHSAGKSSETACIPSHWLYHVERDFSKILYLNTPEKL